MTIAQTLEGLVAEFLDRAPSKLTRRTTRLPSLRGKVDAVVGMRRSGKTCLLLQKAQELMDAGLPRSNAMYLNFEDERLVGMRADELRLVPETLYRRHPEARGSETWFFFDEIQNVPGWERFVRRVVDVERVRVVVSGSSAKLLSTEIATSLRGRSLATELLPFSFREALTHGGVEAPATWPPAARTRSELERAFLRYLEVGGFPEVQGVEDELRLRILRDYVDVVLLRDVAERHGFTNLAALRHLARRLLHSPAGRFSISRFLNETRSLGIAVGKDALHASFGHLQDAFLCFSVERRTRSVKQRQVNPKKIYLVDHGLSRAFAEFGSEDLGARLENATYLELRRRGRRADYFMNESGTEVDFFVERPLGEPYLLQVCADLSSPETRSRELRAVQEAAAACRVGRAVIVTLHDDEAVALPGCDVRIVPAWRWFLDPEVEGGS